MTVRFGPLWPSMIARSCYGCHAGRRAESSLRYFMRVACRYGPIFGWNFASAKAGSWGPAWLGITWTLAIEMQFYVLAAVVISLVPVRLVSSLALAIIVFAALFKQPRHWGLWAPSDGPETRQALCSLRRRILCVALSLRASTGVSGAK